MTNESSFLCCFGAKHKSASIRAASRSGGVFTALSDLILKSGGAVYGCMLDERFQAVHRRATTQEERDAFRGSKYVQSDLGDTFLHVKKDLTDGLAVLFSGTPCQIAGLKAFLTNKPYPLLFLIDIVCHGVPSPKIWKDYLQWTERQHHGAVTDVDFRNKQSYGWRRHVESITIHGTKKDSARFATLFYRHAILRPACYQCPYKSLRRPGDISIADFWGIEKVAPEFDDNKGVSLVIVNSQKGKTFFEAAKDSLNIFPATLNRCMQPPLIAPFPAPRARAAFWKMYFSQPFDSVIKRYGTYSLLEKARRTVRKAVRRIVRG